MAFEITIPRLGWSMEEGTFVRWLKQDGQFVKAGDAVFELEGEKAAQDIEAVDSGILRIPATSPKPGTVVPVGAIVGYLVAEGESIPNSAASNFRQPTAESGASLLQVRLAEKSSEMQAHSVEPAAAPSVRRLAREMGVNLATVEGSGPAGRITASGVRTVIAPLAPENGHGSAQVASPRARRVAGELGVDWRSVSGTGRDGRVRERDVLAAAAMPETGKGQKGPKGLKGHQGDVGGGVVAVSSRRRTIANRMLASCQQTAPVTLTTRLDATNLVNLRNQFKQSANGSVIPSYSDIVIKLVSLALQQHPMLAARMEADHFVLPSSSEDLHIGFAVDTDDGLVVPVIRSAGTLGLFEIAKQSSSLVEKARMSQLGISEMKGGVFTLTNLGNFGVDAFTPIINLPETAVLGLGRIRSEAVVVDNQIVARDQITLSLTFDHRIVDGAPAARFLQSVSQAIENPSAWLLRAEC